MAKKRKHKKTRVLRRFVIALVVIVFVAAALTGAYYCFVHKPDVPPSSAGTEQTGDTGENTDDSLRKQDFYTVLVCGTDDNNGGTDTIMVASVDVPNNKINVVSVPRDTLVDVSWSVKKINSTYNQGGIEKLSETLEDLLGFPIDYYVRVDLNGFVKLIDAIDGVYFDVPINMNYEDPTQDLYIHINKGYQKLDGKTAIKVVRFRHNSDGTGYGTEDIGRIGTQQAFLKAVAEQMLQIGNVSKVGSFAKIFNDYVESDLSVGNMIWFGKTAIEMGSENIAFNTLPGDGSGYYKGHSYYTLNPEEVLTLVNETINPYKEPLTLSDMNILVG